MDEKTLRVLVEAGAVKRLRIIGNGALIHIEADTTSGSVVASTVRGAVKTWTTIDSAARWLRTLGVGVAQIDMDKWTPDQRGLRL